MPLAQVVASSADRISAIGSLGKWLAESCLVKGVDRPAAGALVAMVCMEEGISIAGFLRTYDIVGAKSGCTVRKKALACAAEFRRAGGRYTWLATGDDGKRAAARFEFEGQTIECAYTIEQAEKAGLVRKESAWETSAPDMLRKTVLQKAIAMLAPEIFAGDDSDDAMPVAPARNITPAAEALVDLGHKTTLTTPATASTLQARAVEADVVQPELPATQKPPTPPPVPQATPSPIVSRNVTPAPAATAPRLSDEKQAELVAAIGAENVATFALWAVSQGWLKAGQPMEELELKYANAVVKKADYTREKLREFAAKGGAK